MNTVTKLKSFIRYLVVFTLLISGLSVQAKDHFKLVWSNYTGAAPWGYAAKHGVIERWAAKYGIHIEAIPEAELDGALDAFFQHKIDAITATNIDVISHPKAHLSNTTGLIIGSYSNGNDGILSREADETAQLSGKTIHLSQYSVSHYLLYRALAESDIEHTSVIIIDADEAALSKQLKTNNKSTVSTWNPSLKQLQKSTQANLLFSSADIPHEILDMTFVHEDVDERFKRAITGTWYEIMPILASSEHEQYADMISYMSQVCHCSKGDLLDQLETTHFYTRARRAASLARGPSIKATMEYVRHFSHNKGLLKPDKPATHIGIKYPDGIINGDDSNVIFNFTDRYMLLAANNQL